MPAKWENAPNRLRRRLTGLPFALIAPPSKGARRQSAVFPDCVSDSRFTVFMNAPRSPRKSF